VTSAAPVVPVRDPSLWRRRWHLAPGRQQRLVRSVVSVGNLSMGGRGKSPLVAHIARLLLAAGERPAILSRGYGRAVAEAGVVVVSDGRRLLADLDQSGDEPLMLARELPGVAVLVCEQRLLAGQLAERSLGATVHLLDDGFQHFALARDVDIVIIAPSDLEDRPLPLGRLRESVGALAAADAVVIDGDAAAVALPESARGARVFTLRRSTGAVLPLDAVAHGASPFDGPASSGAERPAAFVVAGVAGPERVITAVERAGWTVAGHQIFPDHHRYSAADVAAIARAAAASGAGVVLTTSKDAVRWLRFRPLPFRAGVVPLEVAVEPEEAFAHWLGARLTAARGAS
jgi:tetraacyldisaccharide 4'-kinase